ncbi:MAG: UDP-N-acetylmuramoyl-L-alanyl-D-glutamate--2,6-diaminopimelate ligase [Rubrivivax sp.]|nr:UDP-N-acetylmuramoyl-L-alanyl-D-glutamate--2,6-diaminopimelate ligase [Rubrivivax sp.]
MVTVLDSAPAAAQWLAAHVRGTLRTDSRAVQPGDGFIAWPGRAHDGRAFVGAALAAGASACLVEHEGVAAYGLTDARVAALPGLKAATGAIADIWFGQPSSQLQVVAATGTNGKTSTTWWMAQALTGLGRRCGVVGTLGVGEPGQVQPTGLTTPDPVALHGTLRRFVDQGFAACALEASSIGIVEHRLAAVRLTVALFTNFTRDHLDYHGSMAAYWAAKRALFGWPGLRAAVLNIDDEQGAALAARLAVGALDIWSVSLRRAARLQAQGLHTTEYGLAFDVVEGAQREPVCSTLVGEFNASNLMVVLGGLRALGVPLADAAAAAAQLGAVPGRLQRVAGPGSSSPVEVVVDYAHTPDALSKVIKALRPLVQARGGRLWCVFGCGGNRDATKRPLMGAIATCGADRVVLTSDNPRDEAPEAILAQILAGVVGHDEVDVIEDRRQAIHHAVQLAAPGDVVLLAGKGHEEYQEVAGVRRPFSDLLEARAALALRELREGAAT